MSSEPATKRGDGGYAIPAPIVHSVVAGLLLTTIMSSGGAIWAAVELKSALTKLENLPSGQVLRERREYTRDLNARQDRRLDRIERSLYGQGSRADGQTVPAMYLPREPSPTPRPVCEMQRVALNKRASDEHG